MFLLFVNVPSAVSIETSCCVKGPTKSERSLQMAPVAELSITKGRSSVSNDIDSLLRLAVASMVADVANILMCMVGSIFRCEHPFHVRVLRALGRWRRA